MFAAANLELFGRLLLLNLTENVVKFKNPSANRDVESENNSPVNDSAFPFSSMLEQSVDQDISSIPTTSSPKVILSNENFHCILGSDGRNSQSNLEPPTPPRTPINTTATTTGTGITTLTGQHVTLDDPQHSRNSTVATSSNNLPKLSVTPVNKLMANNNQQNVYNNNNKAMNDGCVDRPTGRRLRVKRSPSKDYQNSDLDEDGDRDYDLDDDDHKSNSATNSRRYKKKQDRNNRPSNNRRTSDATLITPISDLDDDDDDDDTQENCDGEQRLSSDSGDENVSDVGRSVSGRLKSSGLNSVENFNLNDTSYDSISASLLLQQHKGDSNASKTSSHDFFDKSSLVSYYLCI